MSEETKKTEQETEISEENLENMAGGKFYPDKPGSSAGAPPPPSKTGGTNPL